MPSPSRSLTMVFLVLLSSPGISSIFQLMSCWSPSAEPRLFTVHLDLNTRPLWSVFSVDLFDLIVTLLSVTSRLPFSHCVLASALALQAAMTCWRFTLTLYFTYSFSPSPMLGMVRVNPLPPAFGVAVQSDLPYFVVSPASVNSSNEFESRVRSSPIVSVMVTLVFGPVEPTLST